MSSTGPAAGLRFWQRMQPRKQPLQLPWASSGWAPWTTCSAWTRNWKLRPTAPAGRCPVLPKTFLCFGVAAEMRGLLGDSGVLTGSMQTIPRFYRVAFETEAEGKGLTTKTALLRLYIEKGCICRALKAGADWYCNTRCRHLCCCKQTRPSQHL